MSLIIIPLNSMIHNHPYMQPQKPARQHQLQQRPKPLPHPNLTPPIQNQTHSMLSQSRHSGISHSSHTVPPGPTLQEVAAQLALLAHRVNSHDKRLGAIEARKQEMATWSSESGMLSHTEMSSKQLEPYHSDHQEMMGRIKEELESVNSIKSQIVEIVRSEVDNTRSEMTQELISSFRESLNSKFAQEQQKINACIQELGKAFDKRLSLSGQQLRQQITAAKDALEQLIQGVEASQLHPWEARFRPAGRGEQGEGACELRLAESWCAVGRQQLVVLRQQCTSYFMDSAGCLLDSEHYYILDSQNHPIRLSAQQIDHLNYLGILGQPQAIIPSSQ